MTELTTIRKEDWYGFYENGIRYVNLELLWDDFPDEDNFIKEYSSTYTHEFLHSEIEFIIYELFWCKEEKVVRNMLKEEWNKKVQRKYK